MKKTISLLKKYVSTLLFTSLFINLFCLAGYPQSEELETEQKERIEEEAREELEETEAPEVPEISEVPEVKEKIFKFDWGGWLSSYYWAYINDDNDKEANDLLRNVTYQTMRLWFKATMHKKHLFYFRAKDTYITRRDVNTSYTGEGDDHNGPHVDMCYLNLSLTKRFRLILGRQYLTLGKGIAYNKTHNAVQLKGSIGKFMFKTFFSRTKPRENNVDYSVPGYKKNGHKNFYGSELALINNPKFVPYLYVMFQEDHPKEEPEDATQEYNYNSRYYTAGISAEAFNALDWWIEIIREEGESYTDADTVALEKKDIDAWAGVLGCKHQFDIFTHPSADLEFAYGSGDKDRTRVTNTDGGNLYGNDTNFLYYGYYFAGYALDPRLSNIQIYRLGVSTTPLENFKVGRDLVLGAKFYLYRKDKSAGGIYDTDATQNDKDIGKEMNFYLYWRINPKSTWAFRYGKFFPGDAYPDATNDGSHYFYSSLTVKF